MPTAERIEQQYTASWDASDDLKKSSFRWKGATYWVNINRGTPVSPREPKRTTFAFDYVVQLTKTEARSLAKMITTYRKHPWRNVKDRDWKYNAIQRISDFVERHHHAVGVFG